MTLTSERLYDLESKASIGIKYQEAVPIGAVELRELVRCYRARLEVEEEHSRLQELLKDKDDELSNLRLELAAARNVVEASEAIWAKCSHDLSEGECVYCDTYASESNAYDAVRKAVLV